MPLALYCRQSRVPSPERERGRGEGPALTIEQRRFSRHLRRHATVAEEKLWQAVRGRRLAGLKWRRQVPLLGYTVDFPCLSARLIIEIDGARHAIDAEYDRRRTEELERIGFQVSVLPMTRLSATSIECWSALPPPRSKAQPPVP